MKPGERIFFSGAVLLCPLKQSVCSFGTIFSPSTSNDNSLKFWPIYSPKSNSLISIEHSLSIRGSDSGFPQFPGGGDDADGIYSILTELSASLSPAFLADDDTSIFAIKSISWSGISHIEDCAPIYKGMILDDGSYDAESLRDIELFYPELDPSPTLPLLNIQDSWRESVNRITTKSCPIVFVVGGRNVGKTTYSKYLVNSLLNTHASVGYLDCDLSVPEFSPFGLASVKLVKNPLLGIYSFLMQGPSFTHQQLDLSPDEQSKSIFVGAKSARFDPDSYLEALIRLFNHFCSNQPKDGPASPLIVDCDGWIKGMGFDLLMCLINTANPDFIVCLEPPFSQSEYSGIILSSEIENAVSTDNSEILSVTSALDIYARSKLNASDLRTLSLFAYFSQSVNDPSEPVLYPSAKPRLPYWNFTMPLSYTRPCSVNWDDNLSIAILHAEVYLK